VLLALMVQGGGETMVTFTVIVVFAWTCATNTVKTANKQ